MKRFGFAFLLSCLCLSPAVFGQTRPIQGEFIESSSPLPGGGSVTTRSEPGRKVQTTVTIASLPNNRATNRNFGGDQAQPVQATPASTGNASSVLNRAANAANAQTGQGSSSANRYPYPANYAPNTRVAANGQGPVARTAGLQNNNVNQQVNASRVQYQNNCCQPVANCCQPVVRGGLGLTPVPTFSSQPPIGTQPTGFVGGGVQPTFSQAPQFGLQNQAGGGSGNFGTGQFGAGTGSFGSTSGTGGVYRPLFPLIQTPQNTYLGRGVIGQPEAYVTTQPIRNFFRYILPF